MNSEDLRAADCSVVMVSLPDYKECVVEVEAPDRLLLRLTDELRDGRCLIELINDDESRAYRISLEEYRSLLDSAERKLIGKPCSEE